MEEYQRVKCFFFLCVRVCVVDSIVQSMHTISVSVVYEVGSILKIVLVQSCVCVYVSRRRSQFCWFLSHLHWINNIQLATNFDCGYWLLYSSVLFCSLQYFDFNGFYGFCACIPFGWNICDNSDLTHPLSIKFVENFEKFVFCFISIDFSDSNNAKQNETKRKENGE